MNRKRTAVSIIGGVMLALIIGVGIPAEAQMDSGHMGGHKHGEAKNPNADKMSESLSPHGGVILETEAFQFETVFTESDVRIYVMNADGMAISPRKTKGVVKLQPEKGEATEVTLIWAESVDDPMRTNRVRPGAMANDSLGYLTAAYDFRSVADETLEAHVMLNNLPAEKEKTAHWATPYVLTPLFGMACSMHPDQASLTEGKCSACGGMDMKPATVLYGCCPACADVRRTSPGTCEKCDMELQLKAVDYDERLRLTPAKPRQGGHSH